MSDDRDLEPKKEDEEEPSIVSLNGLVRRSRALAAWVFMFLIAFIVVYFSLDDHQHGFPDSVLLTLTGALLLMLGIQSGINLWRK